MKAKYLVQLERVFERNESGLRPDVIKTSLEKHNYFMMKAENIDAMYFYTFQESIEIKQSMKVQGAN